MIENLPTEKLGMDIETWKSQFLEPWKMNFIQRCKSHLHIEKGLIVQVDSRKAEKQFRTFQTKLDDWREKLPFVNDDEEVGPILQKLDETLKRSCNWHTARIQEKRRTGPRRLPKDICLAILHLLVNSKHDSARLECLKNEILARGKCLDHEIKILKKNLDESLESDVQKSAKKSGLTARHALEEFGFVIDLLQVTTIYDRLTWFNAMEEQLLRNLFGNSKSQAKQLDVKQKDMAAKLRNWLKAQDISRKLSYEDLAKKGFLPK